MLLPGDAAHLEDVNEIGVKLHLNHEIDVREIEVLEVQPIEEDLGCQQLFATDMDRVLRQIERVTKRNVAGGELDLRGERLLGLDESTTVRCPPIRNSRWLRKRVSS